MPFGINLTSEFDCHLVQFMALPPPDSGLTADQNKPCLVPKTRASVQAAAAGFIRYPKTRLLYTSPSPAAS